MKTASVNLPMSQDLKARIEAAATGNQRPITDEINARLEASFAESRPEEILSPEVKAIIANFAGKLAEAYYSSKQKSL